MKSLKRFIRPGLLVSVIGHLAFLALGLHLVGAETRETIPPDAMVVDIVPMDEAPRFAGTPSNARSSGSPVELKSNTASLVAQSPPPKPPPSSQQKQQPAKPQRDASPATAQTQMLLPSAAQAETTNAETIKPEAAPPQQRPEQTPDEPGVAETMAELALVGGALGGGFAAPPVAALEASYDFTAPFRERISSCATLPAGVSPQDKVSAGVRVFLNRDGSLASLPRPTRPMASPKEQALLQAAIEALEKCQPYTMLPPDKYKLWRVLDLDVFPLNFGGGG